MEGMASAEQQTGDAQVQSRFDWHQVNAGLEGTTFHEKLHHFALTDSTQTRALEAAHAGVEAGQVYLADEQHAGRGRGGHTWHSEPDRGLYLTVLLRPKVRAADTLQLSLAAALAAHAAITRTNGTDIDLRWPNDLVSRCDGRKLGGILTETAMEPNGALRHAAIGIGINLHQSAFPADLANSATSLLLESGRRTGREALALALLTQLDAELRALESSGARVLERFTAVSSWVAGKRVHVAEEDGYTGVTQGLTCEGLLCVRDDDGRERIVRHGGVRSV